jgi:hypothetical protein
MDNCWIEFTTKTNKPYWFNIITKKSTFQIPSMVKDCGLFQIPPNWERVKSRTQNKFYFYDRTSNTTQWSLPFPDDQCNKSLSWTGNSCYMDSILQSIFGPGVDNTLAQEILYANLNFDTRKNLCDIKYREIIQSKLREISNTIQNISKKDINNVKEFRKVLRNCPYRGAVIEEQFYGTEMRDAGEFLSYILNFFPISDKAVRKENKYVTNEGEELKLIDESIDYKSSIIININWQTLLLSEGLSLENFLIDELESKFDTPFTVEKYPGKFTHRFTSRKILDSPAIIFSFERLTLLKNITDDDDDGETYYIDKKINVPNRINLTSGKSLNLSAIVIYETAHYTCYFKCKNEWYYYNDMATPKIKKQKLDKEFIGKQGTQYFYT